MKKNRRQFHFSKRGIQISLSLVILWSFATAIFFAFIVKEGKKLRDALELSSNIDFIFLVFVFLGYIAALIVLTSYFTHRFIGPFPRITRELREIVEEQHDRRLSIREKDDPYIRFFIEELNNILALIEKKHHQR